LKNFPKPIQKIAPVSHPDLIMFQTLHYSRNIYFSFPDKSVFEGRAERELQTNVCDGGGVRFHSSGERNDVSTNQSAYPGSLLIT